MCMVFASVCLTSDTPPPPCLAPLPLPLSLTLTPIVCYFAKATGADPVGGRAAGRSGQAAAVMYWRAEWRSDLVLLTSSEVAPTNRCAPNRFLDPRKSAPALTFHPVLFPAPSLASRT